MVETSLFREGFSIIFYMYSFAKLATAATIVLFGAGLNHQNFSVSQPRGIRVKMGGVSQPARKHWLLYRPQEREIVALVGEVEPGEYRLNPKNFGSGSYDFYYEDIPALKDLTKTKLDSLWGSPEEITSEYSSYALAKGSDAWYAYGPGNQKPDFVIDVKFKQNYLSSYRFRSRHLYSQWIDIAPTR